MPEVFRSRSHSREPPLEAEHMEDAVRRYLAEKNITVVREGARGEINCRCPFPDHSDQHSSFSINKESGLWKCHGCSRQGNIPGLLMQLDGMRYPAAMQALERLGIVWKNDLHFDFEEYEEILSVSQPTPNTRLIDRLSIYETTCPQYYLDRGFTRKEWDFWQGHYDEEDKVLIFPVYNEEEALVSLVARYEEGYVRYENLEGSAPKSVLYGIDNVVFRKEVVVCEGLFDTQRVYRLLHEERDVVGLLGSSHSLQQFESLTRWDRIALWLDNDEPGQEAESKLALALRERGKVVWRVPYYTTAKDQAEIDVTDSCLRASFRGKMLDFIET